MNKIVRDRYPVDQLPDDLRAQVGDAREVRVTVETAPTTTPDQEAIRSILDELERLRREGKIAPLTSEEIDARIRELREA